MATGVPKTKWNGKSRHLDAAQDLETDGELILQYQGKTAESEILSIDPAEMALVWSNPDVSHGVQNRLYYGDNVKVMAGLLDDEAVRGKVRLVYIDPPFATKSIFKSRAHSDAYCDLLSGSHYIEFLRKRLIMLRELLADDGSIYVHLDDNMAFHAKVIMDEVFGRSNFRNWITRKKCNPKNYTRKTYGNVSDYILFYTKTDSYVWNRAVESWEEAQKVPKEYQYVESETGRRFMKVPCHAPGVRNGETGKPWRGMLPPPGKHWQYPPKTLDEMDARGEIYWSANGNPRRKVYLDEHAGVPVQDIWTEFRDAHNQNIQITGYPTEKNALMLKRIIEASSNPGDLVMDCFAGSGTTMAVADGLNRSWIGIDNSAEAIQTTLNRFAFGMEKMGDFVQSKKNSQKPEPDVVNLSLFDSLKAVTEKAAEPAVTQAPILEFGLFSEVGHINDMSETAESWRETAARLVRQEKK